MFSLWFIITALVSVGLPMHCDCFPHNKCISTVVKKKCHPQKVKQECSAVKFIFLHYKPYLCGRHELDHYLWDRWARILGVHILRVLVLRILSTCIIFGIHDIWYLRLIPFGHWSRYRENAIIFIHKKREVQKKISYKVRVQIEKRL
jgi:hypothetical protein